MSLRWKNLFTVGVTFIGFLAVILASAAILLNSFSELEIRATNTDALRARDSISATLSEMSSKAGDWANWDDAYSFVKGGNPDFVKANITDNAFFQLKIDLIVFIDSSGRMVYGRAFEQNAQKELPFPKSLTEHLNLNDALLQQKKDDSNLTGVVLIPEGALLVAARPILTSEGQGPAHGTLIFGLYLDDVEIKQWSATTHLSIAAHRIDDPALPADFQNAAANLSPSTPIFTTPLSDQVIGGYALIDDIYGKPALVLRVDDPRVIYAQGQNTTLYLLLALLAIGLTFGSVGFLGLDKMVLGPITRLSKDVTRIGVANDLSARITVPGKDELSSLAQTINQMLESLQRSHTDIAALKDTQSDLRDRIAALQTLANIEQIITSTTGLAERLDRLLTQTLAEMHADIATIYLLNPATGAVELYAQRGARNPDLWSNLKFALGEGAPGWVAQSGQPIALSDVHADSRWNHVDSSNAEGIVSYLSVPIRAGKRIIGVLDIATRTRRGFEPHIVRFLMTLAGRAGSAIENARLFEAEQTRREELSSLYDLSRALADAAYDPASILQIATRQAAEMIDVTFTCGILLEDEEFVLAAVHPKRVMGEDIEIGRRGPIAALPFCQRALEQSEPVILHRDSAGISETERQALFLDLIQTLYIVPLRVADHPLGLLLLGEARSEAREPITPEKIRLARSIGEQAASALRRVELYSELEHGFLQTVLSLAAAVDAKDSYTGDHSERLAKMALAVGQELGMSARDLEDLRYGAILHDIGKIGVPDSILHKPAALDQDEWKQMRQHPIVGAQILAPIPRLAHAAQIVRHHHESFDGKGYPDGLVGENIPLGARILTVVDSYSAIVDKRVYKKERTHQEAAVELERCAGRQFDPHIVQVFLQLMDHELSLAPTIAAGLMAP